MDWRFVNSGFASGARNMALDVAMAERAVDGRGTNVVRVYGWSPPAISLGWNQSEESIDQDLARKSGIDVVRRPTGGRAILHSEELTYAVVMVSSGKNVADVYREISLALVEGLQSLGVDALLERSQPHFPSEYKRRSSVACFTSSARHEIMARGRKLVGSAQRRYARPDGSEVVLQHGSILIGPDHRRIVEFLAGSERELHSEIESELNRHTTDLHELTGRRLPFEEVASAVRRGFESSWGITFSTHSSASGDRTISREERVRS
jgi:lipoyl(octanoyl) transferase